MLNIIGLPSVIWKLIPTVIQKGIQSRFTIFSSAAVSQSVVIKTSHFFSFQLLMPKISDQFRRHYAQNMCVLYHFGLPIQRCIATHATRNLPEQASIISRVTSFQSKALEMSPPKMKTPQAHFQQRRTQSSEPPVYDTRMPLQWRQVLIILVRELNKPTVVVAYLCTLSAILFIYRDPSLGKRWINEWYAKPWNDKETENFKLINEISEKIRHLKHLTNDKNLRNSIEKTREEIESLITSNLQATEIRIQLLREKHGKDLEEAKQTNTQQFSSWKNSYKERSKSKIKKVKDEDIQKIINESKEFKNEQEKQATAEKSNET